MYLELTKSLLIATLLAASAVAQFSYATDASINLPVTSLKYVDSGAGPLKISPAFGDPSKGARSTFVKMPAGFVSKPHTHAADYYAVVISGVVANRRHGGRIQCGTRARLLLVAEREGRPCDQVPVDKRMHRVHHAAGKI